MSMVETQKNNLETDKLSNYRVKFVRDYETLYWFIKEYDPNNYLFDKQHHITLVMEEDKKYKGRQEWQLMLIGKSQVLNLKIVQMRLLHQHK